MSNQGDEEANISSEPLRSNTRVRHDSNKEANISSEPLRSNTSIRHDSNEEEQTPTSSSKWLDRVSACSLLLFGMLFTLGWSLSYPSNYVWNSYSGVYYLTQTNIADYAGFLIIGSIFFALFLCIEIYRRKSDGPLAIMMVITALVGDILWFVGTLRAALGSGTSETFAVLWLSAGLLTLVFYVFDLAMLLLSSSESVFKFSSLALACIASIFMTAGGVAEVIDYRRPYDGANSAAPQIILIIGSVFYLVYALLNICKLK